MSLSNSITILEVNRRTLMIHLTKFIPKHDNLQKSIDHTKPVSIPIIQRITTTSSTPQSPHPKFSYIVQIQSMVEHNRGHFKPRLIKERYYLRPLSQIPIELILSLVIMQVELRLLIRMIMVLRLR